MKTKVCRVCEIEKPITEFNKKKANSDGIDKRCKHCQADYKKDHRNKNRDKINAQKRKRYWDNRDRILAEQKVWRDNNKERKREFDRKYREENKEKKRICDREYKKNKKNTDPIFKFIEGARNTLYHAMKRGGYTKKSRTHEMLCCEWDFFISYIEFKFEKGMTWRNYGKYWVLDHIMPVSFALTEEEVMDLNCYHNFQPLTAEENLKKKNNIFYNEKTLQKCIDAWL